QSSAEAVGPQTKNLTAPEAGPSVPDRVAVSVTAAFPKWNVETEASVAIVGGTQVLKEPPAKSLRTASTCCEARVSARKLPKHGALPSKSWSRSMPPSKNDSTGIGLLEPFVNLSSNVQLGLRGASFVTAQARSSAG